MSKRERVKERLRVGPLRITIQNRNKQKLLFSVASLFWFKRMNETTIEFSHPMVWVYLLMLLLYIWFCCAHRARVYYPHMSEWIKWCSWLKRFSPVVVFHMSIFFLHFTHFEHWIELSTHSLHDNSCSDHKILLSTLNTRPTHFMIWKPAFWIFLRLQTFNDAQSWTNRNKMKPFACFSISLKKKIFIHVYSMPGRQAFIHQDVFHYLI